MAEKVRGPIPKHVYNKPLSEEVEIRLKKRKMVLDTLRQQTAIAEQRLRNEIFNTWRTGDGTMRAIGEACGYTTNWISLIVQKIKNDDDLLEQAIEAWMQDNPDKEVK